MAAQYLAAGAAVLGAVGDSVGLSSLITDPLVKWQATKEQITNTYNRVFKDVSNIEEMSKSIEDEFNLVETTTKQFLSSYQVNLTTLGFDKTTASKYSKVFTKLSLNIASAYGKNRDQVVDNIISSLQSEDYSKLSNYGIKINKDKIKAEALKMGLIQDENTKLNDQQKVIAAQRLMSKQSSQIRGHYSKTGKQSFYGKVDSLKYNYVTKGTEIGEKLLPATKDVVDYINSDGFSVLSSLFPPASLYKQLKNKIAKNKSESDKKNQSKKITINFEEARTSHNAVEKYKNTSSKKSKPGGIEESLPLNSNVTKKGDIPKLNLHQDIIDQQKKIIGLLEGISNNCTNKPKENIKNISPKTNKPKVKKDVYNGEVKLPKKKESIIVSKKNEIKDEPLKNSFIGPANNFPISPQNNNGIKDSKTDKSFFSDIKPGVDDAFKRIEKNSLSAADIVNNSLGQAFDGVANSFTDWVMGAQSFQEAFGNMAQQVLVDLAQMIIKQQMYNLISGLGSALGFGASKSPGTDPGFIGPVRPKFAKGGIFFNGISSYSSQIVDQPTLFPFATGIGLMGEAGPEAIMPLTRNSSGELGVKAEITKAARQDPTEQAYFHYQPKEPKVEINLKNESGESLNAEQESMYRNGPDSLICNVVLKALKNNKHGMRDAIRGVS